MTSSPAQMTHPAEVGLAGGSLGWQDAALALLAPRAGGCVLLARLPPDRLFPHCGPAHVSVEDGLFDRAMLAKRPSAHTGRSAMFGWAG